MGHGNAYYGGITSAEVDKNSLWSDSGPTGAYSAGTAGTGKHSHNTKQEILVYFAGGSVVYQYVFRVKTYESYNGSVINNVIAMGYQTYQVP